MLSEPAVERRVKQHLKDKGYVPAPRKGKRWAKADIVVRYGRGGGGGRFIVVEAKGETGAHSERETKIRTALGQVVAWFYSHENYFFAIAVPWAWREQICRKLTRDLIDALNLRLYLVPQRGDVVEVTKQNFDRFCKEVEKEAQG